MNKYIYEIVLILFIFASGILIVSDVQPVLESNGEVVSIEGYLRDPLYCDSIMSERDFHLVWMHNDEIEVKP